VTRPVCLVLLIFAVLAFFAPWVQEWLLKRARSSVATA
jgi:hypothetical protein